MMASCMSFRDLREIPTENEYGKMTRRLSKDFVNLLNFAMTIDNKTRQGIIREAESHFAGEMFRFYSAILEWEKVYAVDKKRAKLLGFKMVSTFVEPGSMYENGCLSSQTREHLLKRKIQHAHFFEDAKYEVANDIIMNPALKGILERVGSKGIKTKLETPQTQIQ